MSKESLAIRRQHRIMRAIVEHGPLSLPGIRKHAHKPVYDDLRALLDAGYILEAGMVPAGGHTSPIKELMSYKSTPDGVKWAENDLEPKRRGPSKKSKHVESWVLSKSKTTIKLTPVNDVEITHTENTKYTVYQQKFTVTPYVPPKQFMECVR